MESASKVKPCADDAKSSGDDIHNGVERALNFYSVLAIFVAVFGGLLFGLDIGTASITSMNHFREEMGIPIQVSGHADSSAVVKQVSMFPIVFHITTLCGAPFAGQISDRYGRKPVMLAAAILFCIGALWQVFAGMISQSFGWTSILLGRVVGGFGNGFILTIMPVYASELAPTKYRGMTITSFQLFITIGIFVMTLINYYIEDYKWGWRLGFGVQAIPCAIVILMTLFFLPESPRYLVQQDRDDEAIAAIRHLSKGSPDEDKVARNELLRIQEEVAAVKAHGNGSWGELLQGTNFASLLCGIMVSFSQQVTGINWFMNYATQLFSALGFAPFTFDLLLKLLNMVSTILAIFLVERAGRKSMIVFGTLAILGVYLAMFIIIEATGVDVTVSTPDSLEKAVQTFFVAMIFVYQFLFAVTWGPLGFILPAEIFPTRVRGKGMSIAIASNMVGNICFGDFGYQNLNAATSMSLTMVVVVLANVMFVLVTALFLVPETKSVVLEDIPIVFGFCPKGDAAAGLGTMRQFAMRNGKQAKSVLACKSIDPQIEIAAKRSARNAQV
uniref:Hexose transporter 1 n=1 Tax=Mucochytrium quahogii TaxID=96639 RepID=A0A7S2RH78_9STRA|mmetsp:Transcript_33066/g.53029  ORF Transcript_33066/g.53029 Transcript_33066/m.53029 type:complete len:558 (+) Transcript_33066:3291-4964(+)|eukprot:CAMPEP_0203754408 /NCGR_PEP_ID=MMETSP0098-20131031/7996_1 /ASSEMBLY_ACC=CAM_ASM_000208 /TAXON_ID=96639 /ORGANISM=" , Strain NY0313808BC1" /LENGTH=557 /DNA_ID=CAMNT_0050645391 /DNA_START=3248 /DNA_END=4921 /DNA_ORIENTATION=+